MGANMDDISRLMRNPGSRGSIERSKGQIVRSIFIKVAAALAATLTAALIVSPLAAAADNATTSGACAPNQISANVVRTAQSAGDHSSACS